MSGEKQRVPSGWYVMPGETESELRYWDGERWLDEPEWVPPSRDVVETERAARLEEAVRRTGARPGEGIPFHELYLRRSSKKGNWRS